MKDDAEPQTTVASQALGRQPHTLPLDQLCTYDRNPRHAVNPEYGRIKASIRVRGLDQPLIVTQRPGEATYRVHTGGNTRLQILKELLEETGDARFAEAPCLVRPWTREVDVLLAHLRENDLRGPLTFIDKAMAVDEARRLLEAAKDGQRMQQKTLVETLREQGYLLSPALACQMIYAVERLLPLIPQALHGGMGRPQVERIRQLERAARVQWLERLANEAAEFEPTFAALCRRYDDPDWDITHLRRALEAEVAERAEVSIHAIGLSLEQALSGRRATAHNDAAVANEDSARQQKTYPDASANDTKQSAARVFADATPADPHPATARDTDPAPSAVAAARESVGAPAADASSEGRQGSRADDIKSLRARAWTLASRLAQRNGLSELIVPVSGQGLGFVLTDVPDPALVDRLDDAALAQVSMVWWHLAAAAEMTVAPLDHLLPHMDDASVLYRALYEHDAGLLFSSVWTLDPGHAGYRLWRQMGERDWQDFRDLMANYRALHHAAKAAGVSLWQ